MIGVDILTPLHRALGREAAPLDLSILREAIDSSIAEAADLDWKKELPHAKSDDAGDEFAKDVAAMANSGGGWIVYGVGEDGHSRASDICPVRWDSSESKRLRALAYGRVYPPAVGVDFEVVEVEGGAVVAMRVPDSAEAPHFARYRQNALRAPQRNGPETVFMSEREIERAYAARFARRRAWHDDMQDLFGATARASARSRLICGVLVARPAEPSPRGVRIDKSLAQTIFSAISGRKICAPQLTTIHHGNEPVRPGLRSWVLRLASPQGARAVVHADGSASLSVDLGGWSEESETSHVWPVGQPFHTIARAVEWFVDDGVALASATVETLGVNSPVRVMASIVGPGEEALVIRDEHALFRDEWRLADESQSRPVTEFEAVAASMTAQADQAERYDVARELALDLLNQAGIEGLKSIRAPR
ncbi:hypothetical protein GCM10025883_42200 [Mobilicoccus caccae]|uniref:Schlafen AlbA-2 domain-containing protein n=1 Tax=Mobilicoccus caccae TaxID=1859295 RepID=A0ABQ6IW51_9MICO|nr:hypothetical protein GCM10025883_42200 [Mobilicoccus caccae]